MSELLDHMASAARQADDCNGRLPYLRLPVDAGQQRLAVERNVPVTPPPRPFLAWQVTNTVPEETHSDFRIVAVRLGKQDDSGSMVVTQHHPSVGATGNNARKCWQQPPGGLWVVEG